MSITTNIRGLADEGWGALRDAVTEIVKSRAYGGLSEEEREDLRDELEKLLEFVSEVHEPRVALVGDTAIEAASILDDLLATPPSDARVKAEIGAGRWYDWETPSGTLHLLDARGRDHFGALRYGLPDVVIQYVDAATGDADRVVEQFRAIDEDLERYGALPPLVAVLRARTRGIGDIHAARLSTELERAAADSGLNFEVVTATHHGRVAEEVADLLPPAIRFPWARLSTATRAQEKAIDRVIGIASSIAGTLATVPLPLASTLPITTVQVILIATIAWVSGRPRSLRTVGEFLTAAGLNIGAGYALRELARALVGFVPVAGSVVSAGIAAGATVAVGTAAKRYFLRVDDR